jgi:ParB family chromosome partitioning protein
LRDQAGGITWARELLGVSKKLLTPTVVDAVVRKVNQKRVTNSKELRKLRVILPDPVAREHFLSKDGDLDSAMMRVGPPAKKDRSGLSGDLDAAIESMKRVPWTALSDLKGDPEILRKIDDAEALLRSLRKNLAN